VTSPLELRNKEGDFLSIDPMGGKIEVTLGGEKLLTKVIRGDGNEGKTHPCSPNFDEVTEAAPFKYRQLKRHGNERKELCNVLQSGPNEVTIAHAITDTGYPEGVTSIQKLKIENGIFSLDFTHDNQSNESVPINAGEHFYFDAPNSYKGTKVNGVDISELIENNEKGIGIELQEENVIEIPGKPKIILKQTGFNKAFVWVGRNEKGAIDKNYVCIEPIEFHPSEFGLENSMISAGQKRTASLSISFNH
jgi:galactose mutarotase-like enzyme